MFRYSFIYKNTRVSLKFGNILVHASLQHIYCVIKGVQAMVGTIMVVSALTHALLHCNLKTTKMNV